MTSLGAEIRSCREWLARNARPAKWQAPENGSRPTELEIIRGHLRGGSTVCRVDARLGCDGHGMLGGPPSSCFSVRSKCFLCRTQMFPFPGVCEICSSRCEARWADLWRTGWFCRVAPPTRLVGGIRKRADDHLDLLTAELCPASTIRVVVSSATGWIVSRETVRHCVSRETFLAAHACRFYISAPDNSRTPTRPKWQKSSQSQTRRAG